eukprot:1160158-Pelagomonas_calceolata.AAC.2
MLPAARSLPGRINYYVHIRSRGGHIATLRKAAAAVSRLLLPSSAFILCLGHCHGLLPPSMVPEAIVLCCSSWPAHLLLLLSLWCSHLLLLSMAYSFAAASHGLHICCSSWVSYLLLLFVASVAISRAATLHGPEARQAGGPYLNGDACPSLRHS